MWVDVKEKGISPPKQDNLFLSTSSAIFGRHSTAVTSNATIEIYRSASKSAPVPLLSCPVCNLLTSVVLQIVNITIIYSKLDLQLHSPSLKVHEDGRGPMAVFADRDQVGGKVILDSPDDALVISVSLTFSFFRSDLLI